MNYTKKELLKPYEASVNSYLAAGWDNVLPLPPMSKFAPPKGFTGVEGKTPDENDLVDFVNKGGNVALRLPDFVVGLDVDNYGGKLGQKTFNEHVQKLGLLPNTWVSSRHENTDNGRTLLFRVPAGTKFISGLKDIDVIQNTHRYLTAPPSIHPTAVPYSWYSPSGQIVSDLIVPDIDDLPELPKKWLDFLTEKETKKLNYNTVDSVAPWNSDLDWLPQGNACRWEKGHVTHYAKKLETATSRHDQMMSAIMTVLYSGLDGHRGARFTLEALRDIFIPMIALDRGPRVAAREFDSMVTWGVTQLKLNGAQKVTKSDPCSNYQVDITEPEPRKKKQGKTYGNVSRA